MLNIRQGKGKLILENSIHCALTAVETYNRPTAKFRVESYIVLMIMAWTKLFHAYFYTTIGNKYFYKEKNGHYKRINGEKRAWELKECISQYQKYSGENLQDGVIANLNFFIGIRNKVEHQYWLTSYLDLCIFGECQSLLYNFETMLIHIFGESYSLNASLAYSLQFSTLNPQQRIRSQKELLTKEVKSLKKYIDKYRTALPQSVFDTQEYSVKVLLLPKISGTDRGELAVEFVNWSSLNEEDRDNYSKVAAIIKDKRVKVSVSNADMFKPSKVIQLVEVATKEKLTMNNHTDLWKAFEVRPNAAADEKMTTKEKYCIYDEPHNDYLYSQEWVNFIVKLIQNYGFRKENIRQKCRNNKLSISNFD